MCFHNVLQLQHFIIHGPLVIHCTQIDKLWEVLLVVAFGWWGFFGFLGGFLWLFLVIGFFVCFVLFVCFFFFGVLMNVLL